MPALTLTDSNFEAEVLASREPVLVDLWARWCPSCVAIGPTIDAMAQEFAGRAKVAKLNVDENQVVAGRLGIRSLPAFLVFKNGRVVDQVIGAVPRSKLVAALEKASGT